MIINYFYHKIIINQEDYFVDRIDVPVVRLRYQ